MPLQQNPGISQHSARSMQPFVRDASREFYALRLQRPAHFTPPFSPMPYPCLIWDAGGEWTSAERSQLVAALLDTDARYAVCGGAGCERWHDELDEMFIARYLDDQQAQAAHFLMTSWHSAESPEEVAFFFAYNTNFDAHEFTRFLVLCVGTDAQGTDRLTAAVSLAVQDPERFMTEHPVVAG